VKLIFLIVLFAFAFLYANFLKTLITSGSWLLISAMLIWPFVLAYLVGNEEDRKDFHKIIDWLRRR
jgi:predicted membrane-bound dolichyl-phosphate-mannose-protein mannosyltransferase